MLVSQYLHGLVKHGQLGNLVATENFGQAIVAVLQPLFQFAARYNAPEIFYLKLFVICLQYEYAC